MFIVSGMTPATKTQSAMSEVLASFERNSDAHKMIKQFNVLGEEEKFKMRGSFITVLDMLEKEEQIDKNILVKNKYTIMYVEQV